MDDVKLGDLRALAMIDGGLSMTSTGHLTGKTVNHVRNQLIRIEKATGKRVYERRKKFRGGLRLTRHGGNMAALARNVIGEIDGNA